MSSILHELNQGNSWSPSKQFNLSLYFLMLTNLFKLIQITFPTSRHCLKLLEQRVLLFSLKLINELKIEKTHVERCCKKVFSLKLYWYQIKALSQYQIKFFYVCCIISMKYRKLQGRFVGWCSEPNCLKIKCFIFATWLIT